MEPEILSAFQYKGFHCEVQQMPILGHLCGYVDLPKDHKYFGTPYDDINVDVHGGLTYSNVVDGSYRIGFDCAHASDFVPGMMFHSENEHFWTVDEVSAELKCLVRQLVE